MSEPNEESEREFGRCEGLAEAMGFGKINFRKLIEWLQILLPLILADPNQRGFSGIDWTRVPTWALANLRALGPVWTAGMKFYAGPGSDERCDAVSEGAQALKPVLHEFPYEAAA